MVYDILATRRRIKYLEQTYLRLYDTGRITPYAEAWLLDGIVELEIEAMKMKNSRPARQLSLKNTTKNLITAILSYVRRWVKWVTRHG